MHGGERFDMVNMPKPLNDDFLLLETINQEKGSSRGIHMLVPNKKGMNYKLGRGHEADVKITDISVSRLHAYIKCTKQGFMIIDNKSKFGTLVCKHDKVTFKSNEQPSLQIGRTKFVATIREAIEMVNKERVTIRSVKTPSIAKDEGILSQKEPSGSEEKNKNREDERQCESIQD